jgi:hypothetical protein
MKVIIFVIFTYISLTQAIVFNTYVLLAIWAGASTAPILLFNRTNTGYNTIVKVSSDGLKNGNGNIIKKGQMLQMKTNGNCPVLCLKSGDIYSAIIYPKQVGLASKYVNINEQGAYKPDTGSKCMEWKPLYNCQLDNCEFYNSYRSEFGKNCANFLVN